MKTSIQLIILASLCMLLSGCKDELNTTNCGTPATVRDLGGLDGCWYAFELGDGTRLVPVWDMVYCGTPPLPKEVTEDPLYNFQFTEGKKVTIGYEDRPNKATTYMAGRPVRITCLEEMDLEGK